MLGVDEVLRGGSMGYYIGLIMQIGLIRQIRLIAQIRQLGLIDLIRRIGK